MISTLAVVAGLSKTGGGTSYSVPAWSNALAREQVQRYLVTVRARHEQTSGVLDEKLVHLERVPSFGLGSFEVRWSLALRNKIESICVENHIQLIHNHGVWLPANHTASSIAHRFEIPCVITPHGMLTQWAFNNKSLKKSLAWRLYQKDDLDNAKLVHVTAQSEGDDLRKLGFRGPLAVIPNGLDLPEWVERVEGEKEFKTLLFVSRIHPKKGLLNLVEAWSRIKPKGWKVKLVGPDEGGYQAVVERAIHEKGLDQDFVFTGPVYGAELTEIYRAADLFVLPTFSENFGNVVPEALANGLPVLCTEGAPWEELNSRRCGWWFPIGVEHLEKALREALEATPAQRREMGKRGRQLVEEKYTWPSVAKEMKQLYEWVLGGGSAPSFVRIGS